MEGGWLGLRRNSKKWIRTPFTITYITASINGRVAWGGGGGGQRRGGRRVLGRDIR